MANKESNSIIKARKRKFYEVSPNYRGGAIGLYLQDESLLRWEINHLSDISGELRFVFDKSRGVLPRDLELYHTFWLVSDRAKVTFESLDPDGFAFLPCAIEVPGGSWEGQRYWLCEVVRVLDVLDEAQSRFVKIGIGDDPGRRDFGKKFYHFSESTQLVFKEDLIGDARVFRMAHYFGLCVICDQNMKDACKKAGLKGIWFHDVLKSAY